MGYYYVWFCVRLGVKAPLPTKKRIELIRDYIVGEISFVDFLKKAKDKQYV